MKLPTIEPEAFRFVSITLGSDQFFFQQHPPQLKDVAHRVLRLRKLSLDEIEEKMLDVLLSQGVVQYAPARSLCRGIIKFDNFSPPTP